MAEAADEKKAAEAYETQAYEALEKDFQSVSRWFDLRKPIQRPRWSRRAPLWTLVAA